MKHLTVLDLETFYTKDDYSITQLGNYHYFNDPRFNCYMVSIARDDGFQWCGHPSECPWEEVFGEEVELVSHNRDFDKTGIERMHELGLIPKPVYAAWHNSADLCAYLGAPRSLAGAAQHLLGKEMSKDMRSHMNGKMPTDLTPEKYQALKDYAQMDALHPLEIWQKYESQWPEHERWLSEWTAMIPKRGIPMDLEAVDAGIVTLGEQRDLALAGIPWASEHPPLSRKYFAEYCESHELPVPQSMAKDSEEFQEWLDTYAGDHPVVNHVRNYRRTNTFWARLKTIRRKIKDGKFCGDLLYFGASVTGRWSGAGGYNLQNASKEEMFGVDMRGLIKAPPGYTFVVADSSQIEPRCLGVLSGNKPLLDSIRSGYGIYEAYARANLGWNKGNLKEEDKKLYSLAKAGVLGLGFGCGAVKFVAVARIMAGLDVLTLQTELDKNTTFFDKKLNRWYNPAEIVAKRLVDEFRKVNPLLAAQKWKDGRSGFWEQLELHLEKHAGTGQVCTFELPSGRLLRYFDVKNIGGLSCVTCSQGRMARRRTWGSLTCENVTQGFARDVIGWQKRRIEEDVGIPVLFSVHDEFVCLSRIEDAEENLAKVLKVMHTAPPWCPTLPVAAEGMIVERYTK